MASTLKDWSKANFGSVRKQIRNLEQKLFHLRGRQISKENLREERDIEQKLSDLFECEDIMAKQRSRVEWLREGDRNTAFFHGRASVRRCTNHIDTLTHDDGSKCESQPEKMLAHNFYENLFLAEPCDLVDDVLDAIPSKVTLEMNSNLCKRIPMRRSSMRCSKWDLRRLRDRTVFRRFFLSNSLGVFQV
jgi:hypothetical protein